MSSVLRFTVTHVTGAVLLDESYVLEQADVRELTQDLNVQGIKLRIGLEFDPPVRVPGDA